jgi:hypothetical protein
MLVCMIGVTIVALYIGPETKDRDMDVDMFSAADERRHCRHYDRQGLRRGLT